ncbi:MAG: TIGR04086 family membrane protein [Clostridiales bacterium]|nr:TIGR04086 family membrane protein [Clostridiales bacterium]
MEATYIRQRKSEGAKSGKKSALAVIKGLAFSVILGVLLVFLFCAAAMKFPDPDKIAPAGVLAMLLAAFFGGLFAARKAGDKGFSTGALTGFLFVLLIALAALILKFQIKTSMFALTAPAAILASALGGAAGIGKGKKPKSKKRKKF